MKLSLSYFARDRRFSRAMRRIDPWYDTLMEAFQNTDFTTAAHRAILVDVTDDKKPDFFFKVPNSDGFFQIIVGCTVKESDIELAREVLGIIRRVVDAYPFCVTDKEKVRLVFKQFEESFQKRIERVS